MQLPNLLNLALTVIPKQAVTWYKSTGSTEGGNGLMVTTFADPVTVVGSFQPVPRNLYEALGLQWNRDYVNFYTSTQMDDVGRDATGDEFEFPVGYRYHVMSNTEWHPINGWNGNMAIKIVEGMPNA